MTDLSPLEGLLNLYRLATAAQPGPFSAIEAARQDQRATEAALEIAALLTAADVRVVADVLV
jgi:hypothetical protein